MTISLPLIFKNLWRVGNVWLSRHLGWTPRYAPILLLFVTNRCNLKCKMCGVCEHDHAPAIAKELTTDEWKQVIDAGRRLGTTLVSITGGEPLLRRDLYELIAYARNQGMAVHMCSNGLLLDEDAAVKLSQAGVGTVSISIESPSRETHEQLRGKGSFDPAVQAVRNLRAFAPDVRVGINYLITTANYHNMADMIPFAESLDAHQFKSAPIHTNLLHRRKRLEHYGDLIFGQEDVEDLEREVNALIEAAHKSHLQTTSTMFFSGISRLYTDPHGFRCYAGYASCAVDPEGRVSPCCDMDSQFSVRDRPLDEIWLSPAFDKMREKVRNCSQSCWDTTNTELSLHLSMRALLSDIPQTWRDVRFYFGRKSDR
jgi:MoaA/NifB/PqqE/SkfB family radical SAM enzyme